MKPYASSCEDNKNDILTVIKPYLENKKTLLEIASGTGQHAVYFSQFFPKLMWQPSDLSSNLDGINQWLHEAQLSNILDPFELDVSKQWPTQKYEAVFSANALHIMNINQVEDCFTGLGKVLEDKAVCLFYGPFNYSGNYTSESNKNFDVWLKNNNPLSCIKDFETICDLAQQQGLQLINDHEMPANNRILVFIKSERG